MSRDRTAKLFMTGRSQAVRLPREFRSEGREVCIGREGGAVVLTRGRRRGTRCLFAGKGHRGTGAASVALEGAIEMIRSLGGGRVEGYPEDIEGRKASPAFLFNGALSTFERFGFERSVKIGKYKWVVTRTL